MKREFVKIMISHLVFFLSESLISVVKRKCFCFEKIGFFVEREEDRENREQQGRVPDVRKS